MGEKCIIIKMNICTATLHCFIEKSKVRQMIFSRLLQKVKGKGGKVEDIRSHFMADIREDPLQEGLKWCVRCVRSARCVRYVYYGRERNAGVILVGTHYSFTHLHYTSL